MNEKNLNKLGY